jgi:DNA polymerase alpha subunit B
LLFFGLCRFPQPPIEDTIPDGGKVINEIPETTEIPFGSLCLDNIETAGKRKIPKEMSERRVHVVSNPSTIKINEVTFGVTSTDALLHLSTEEINQKLPPGTRICRLAEHFVRQQSFYPLFPAPTATGMRVNLDINKRSEYAMNVQPDVLILPSKLTCLVDGISDETIVLNPGYLVKGATGGSYAVIDIHPMKVDKLTESEDDEIAIALKDRIRVEIRKI